MFKTNKQTPHNENKFKESECAQFPCVLLFLNLSFLLEIHLEVSCEGLAELENPPAGHSQVLCIEADPWLNFLLRVFLLQRHEVQLVYEFSSNCLSFSYRNPKAETSSFFVVFTLLSGELHCR